MARTLAEMAGGVFGNPGPNLPGIRGTPNQVPAPNSEPLGSRTGVGQNNADKTGLCE